MIIKPLSQKDLDTIFIMDQEYFPPEIAFSKETFQYCLDSYDCLGLGMYKNEALLGFIIVQAQSRYTANIITIEVDQSHRRKTIASQLLSQTERLLRNAGIRRVTLQVALDNLPAKSLYAKWGYKDKNRLNNYYATGQHALKMDKKL